MIAQGLIKSAERKEYKGPECPHIFIGTLEKYRSIKFLQRDNGDSIVVYPRETLSWQDLNAFLRVSGQELSMLESELIMGLEGIFEGRYDD